MSKISIKNPLSAKDQSAWSVKPFWSWFAEGMSESDCPPDGAAHPVRGAAEYAIGGDFAQWSDRVKANSEVIIQGEVSPSIVSHLSFEGSRPPQLIENKIEMSTTGGTDDRSLAVFRTAPETFGALYWMRVRIDRAVDDQCQLRLIHTEGYEEEILRIKSRSVVVAKTQEFFIPFIGAERLVCIVADGPFLHVYIDGMLCLRRARSRSECPTGFILDMNTNANDGQAVISGLGLAALDTPFRGLSLAKEGHEDAVPARLTSELLTQGHISEAGKILYAIGDLPLAEHANSLSDTLSKITDPSELSRHWVINPILDTMPEDEAALHQERIQSILGKPMVSVKNAGVKFLSNPAEARSLWAMMSRGRDHKLMNQVFQDIHFDLYAGDTLGIIGHNGAGKTTLLRTIAGVIGLSEGRIEIRGESVLLRPGAGMREDLTGRQNILLGSVFMGLSMAQAHEIMDDVIAFSELGDAIERPYKYYSDGMRSRLIFSIATALPPDILMLDELLGAGDLSFQQKANDRLAGFIDRAKVVIVVEHGLSFVATKCNKALYIGNNQRVFYGDPQIAIAQYMSERESEARQLPYGEPIYSYLHGRDA